VDQFLAPLCPQVASPNLVPNLVRQPRVSDTCASSLAESSGRSEMHSEVPTLLSGACDLKVIQTWFNSESGMEAGVSQLRHVGLVSIVRRGD
jgi:hypothetical protein